MNDSIYNLLFLCTGNSARSILAEALMNHWGRGKFRAYSAGSHPTGSVNPYALAILRERNLPFAEARSKSWDEFAAPGAPKMDFIITVCDSAAGEVCPIWPGQPVVAHWGIADPAAVNGSEEDIRRAFRAAAQILEARIKLFSNLPIASLKRLQIKEHMDTIGKTRPHAAD